MTRIKRIKRIRNVVDQPRRLIRLSHSFDSSDSWFSLLCLLFLCLPAAAVGGELQGRRRDEQHHAAARPADHRRLRAVSFDAHSRRTARPLPGAGRRPDEAGPGRLRSARHSSHCQRRSPPLDSGRDGHSDGERADLRHAHPFGFERAGPEPPETRADARRLSEVRRAAHRRRCAVRGQQPAARGDRLRHGRGAGARLQSPLAHESRHDAGQSVRRARPGEDEPARRQSEPRRARRPDRSDDFVHCRPRHGRQADLGLRGLFAALCGRRRQRAHLGRLFRRVLRRAGAPARCRAARSAVRRPAGQRHQRRHQQHQLPRAAAAAGALRPDAARGDRRRQESPRGAGRRQVPLRI